MAKRIKKFGDLVGKNLNGWRVIYAYYIIFIEYQFVEDSHGETTHTRQKTYRVVSKDRDCSDIIVLGEDRLGVLDNFPNAGKDYHWESCRIIANRMKRIAFRLDSVLCDDKPLRLLRKKELNLLISSKKFSHLVTGYKG